MLTGAAASPGIGIGKAVLIKQEELVIEKRRISYLQAEKQRFLDAVESFVAEIEDAYDLVINNVSESEAAILSTQIAIIRDPDLTTEVLESIEEQRVNVEYVFNSICNRYITLFSNLEDELMRARSADFQDIKDRMLSILLGVPYNDMSVIPPGSILVANDIPPSQAARIDPKRVEGIVTRAGTKFSHISIIARALRLPAAVAVESLLEMVGDGDVLIVDGSSGRVWINPGEGELVDYRERMVTAKRARDRLEGYKNVPTKTLDGVGIDLAANLALPRELTAIREYNADGVGLFRTEFMFLERKNPPSESEQFECYRNVAQAMDGRMVIIRTLDVGGDKELPYMEHNRGDNPFLGYRAVRFSLEHEDLFRTQLAAILRAAVFGNVMMMLPMISSLGELRRVKVILEEVKQSLRESGRAFREDIELGVMLETPAAVLCAEDLAGECDFFSIGTNDLTQYVLAVDRTNGSVSHLYCSHHPAVLRMLKMAVDAANRVGKPIGVCGEAAADPILIPILLGLGIRKLSVATGAFLDVRSRINSLSYEFWVEQAPTLLSMKTPEEVSDFIRSRI